MVALLASCSAAYKIDQTPDDVYYSPGKVVGEEQQKDNTNQDDYSYNKEDDNYLITPPGQSTVAFVSAPQDSRC